MRRAFVEACPQVAQIAVDNPEPSCEPPPEVDKPDLDECPPLPEDASYAEILDWLTGGGVPMGYDLLEATGIWLGQQHG